MKQFVVAQPLLSANTQAIAQVSVEKGIPFISADQAREKLIAKGVSQSEIETAVMGYQKSQQHALAMGCVMVISLGAGAWLLAQRMPSKTC